MNVMRESGKNQIKLITQIILYHYNYACASFVLCDIDVYNIGLHKATTVSGCIQFQSSFKVNHTINEEILAYFIDNDRRPQIMR